MQVVLSLFKALAGGKVPPEIVANIEGFYGHSKNVHKDKFRAVLKAVRELYKAPAAAKILRNRACVVVYHPKLHVYRYAALWPNRLHFALPESDVCKIIRDRLYWKITCEVVYC